MGIMVVGADGAKISVGQAILRALGYTISSILMLGFINMIFDANRQGWHDKIAKTYVVTKSK